MDNTTGNVSSGNVYVADYDNNLLNIYNPIGTPLTPLATPAPVGVAVDSSGNVYVTDAANNLVRKYSFTGVNRNPDHILVHDGDAVRGRGGFFRQRLCDGCR